MASLLRHRGPDQHGVVTGALADHTPFAFSHRRLSVLDLSEAGRQPMVDPETSAVLVFNGEVYNHREIRRRNERHYRSTADTETLLYHLQDAGISGLSTLQGMFAFAMVKPRSGRVLLGRDRLGVKPLYYAQLPCGSLAFASEMKALLDIPGFSPHLDLAALDEYLAYLYVPYPRTMFREISQLPPAHYLTYHNGSVAVHAYWSIPTEVVERGEDDFGAAAEELSELLRDAVESRLLSDVPVGAFLSGGVDSSAIVAFMTKALGEPPRTFSIRFSGADAFYDESEHAREGAHFFQTRHTELTVTADAAKLLPTVTRAFDEPFGNPTALLVYELCRLTREHVTVALSGDGGDEVFGGYPRYQGLLYSDWYQRIPRRVRAFAGRSAAVLPESTRGWHGLRRAKEFLAGNHEDAAHLYADWVGYFKTGDRDSLYAEPLRSALGARSRDGFLTDLFANGHHGDSVARSMRTDLASFLPCNILAYVDRVSMAHALEVRAPFTDVRLVEFMARLPSRFRVSRSETKRLFRRALRGLVPDVILSRRKRGLNPPVGEWLKNPLRGLLRDHLGREGLAGRGLFNENALEAIVLEHESGRRDRSLHLWGLIALEEWFRVYRPAWSE